MGSKVVDPCGLGFVFKLAAEKARKDMAAYIENRNQAHVKAARRISLEGLFFAKEGTKKQSKFQ